VESAFKYHGLGNDFVILDRRAQGNDIDATQARSLCDRRLAIGADGVLVILPSRRGQVAMVVHNADGSIAEMCGNGIRCVAKYLGDRNPEHPTKLSIETAAGVLTCSLHYGEANKGVDLVEVSMGRASLVADNLPSRSGKPFVEHPLEGGGGPTGTAVSLGNPHLVIFDRPPERIEISGPALERHPEFPERTNVEWAEPAGKGFRVVVWERGAGQTLACGTGACAVVAAAVKTSRVQPDQWIPIQVPGGQLEVRCRADLSNVELRGPATFVFEAKLP
jgi:diaminopimelate epimerase